MADSSVWKASVDTSVPGNPCATLTVARSDLSGGAPLPIKLKGVCYSPAPMNGSNAYAPAIGDWYWDGFTVNGTTIQGWDALWARDRPGVRGLYANTMRVYCMLSRQLNQNGTFPTPWDSGRLFTHATFLDLCWNAGAPPEAKAPTFALVGIPLPANMFWLNQYKTTPPAEIEYWTNVLRETAQTTGLHPGVAGYTIQNEQDGADVCYNDPTLAAFWWAQIEKMAGIVKAAAPDKLVGMATHDDPNIPAKAAQWMAQCPHIDFWGVNAYQTQNFDATFGNYRTLSGSALKPVLLTEYGIPATGHHDPNNPSTIYESADTRPLTAAVVGPMLPKALADPLCLGIYYFEYCDEWWNQPEAPNIYTWWGGKPASGFPNGFWDNDGFGLYSVQRGSGLPPDAPIWGNNGPALPIDVHTERTEITAVIKAAFGRQKVPT